MVQPVGLTVELPSTTHGLAPARTDELKLGLIISLLCVLIHAIHL